MVESNNKNHKPDNNDRGSRKQGDRVISENTNERFRRGRIINKDTPTSKPTEPKPSK